MGDAKEICLNVKRKNGSDGQLMLDYTTVEGTAKQSIDYTHTKGHLHFKHMETEKVIKVPLLEGRRKDKTLDFEVHFDIVGYPQCGAKYGEFRKCDVSIAVDAKLQNTMKLVSGMISNRTSEITHGGESWAQQFTEAATLHGDVGQQPTCRDFFLHCMSMPWKVLFAFVPPTTYAGGWLTFCVSIIFIGALTVLVADVASIFGCLIGAPTIIIGIVFVALGTPMPDLFASMQAAREAESADASIGNVTGSNSVNVFMGQGLPWLVATIWHLQKGTEYRVEPGALGFSVVVYTGCALVCITIFAIRRNFCGGELGGPTTSKYISACIMLLLWIVSVVLSYLQSVGTIPVD